MAAETFEQWWNDLGSRFEYPPQAAEEAWIAATEAAEAKFASTNNERAAALLRDIANLVCDRDRGELSYCDMIMAIEQRLNAALGTSPVS